MIPNQSLVVVLVEAQKRLGLDVMRRSNELVREYQKLRVRAEELGADRFQHERFTQTGTELWYEFIQTAHQLARAESDEDTLYPWEEDFCLFCQQPLSQEARMLVLKLWAYLAGEVRHELKRIESDIVCLSDEIKDQQNFAFSNDFAASKAFLMNAQPELGHCVERQIKAYGQLEKTLLEALSSHKIMGPADGVLKDCSQTILSLIEQIDDDISEMEQQDLVARVNGLQAERQLLDHRQKLKELLPEIGGYLDQRVWARDASEIGGSTRHITREHNRIFEQLVKNRYIAIFEETLRKLGRPIQVEIVTSGRKGKTVKQIQLKAHRTARNIADPEKVLSEGEKRAVALADFLTEAALDTTCGGIVMDDPVTSLDLEWRNTIAKILVEEAQERQVIVFSHDLPFVYLLLKHAREQNVQENVHWIKRGDVNDRPGYVYIDNCPALEKEYKSSQQARDSYSRGKKADTPEERSILIREGMAALRTSYEALVVYEYFGGVVERFEERISLGRLPALVWDDDVSNNIDENYGRLSRHIEGHLHSDALAEPLTLKMLLDEIETFDGLKKRIRNLKKNKV